MRPSGAAVARNESSLIICSRNRPQLLREAVESILQGSELPAELLIVDQSDSPDPYFLNLPDIDHCRIRYIHHQSVGLCRARNAGVAAARHEILFFTDDDVLVSEEWFARLAGALREEGPDAVITGRVLPVETGPAGGFVPTLKLCDTRSVTRGRARFDPLVTFNMALRRSTLIAVGGFDPRMGPGTSYPAGEDNELAFRLLEHGCRIVALPEAVLFHRAWRSEREYVRLRWGYGLGHGAFLAKHFSARDSFMLRRFMGTLLHVTLRAPRQLWTGKARPGRMLARSTLAAGDLAFAGGTLVGALDWLLRGHRTPA